MSLFYVLLAAIQITNKITLYTINCNGKLQIKKFYALLIIIIDCK